MEIMKKQTIPIGLGLAALLTNSLYAADLEVSIQGVTVNDGALRVGLFAQAAEFPRGTPVQGIDLTADSETVTAKLTGLAAGRYALAVFQDKNNNQKLDTNFFGIPKEAYGFSNTDKAGSPEFDQAAFEITDEDSVIAIQLRWAIATKIRNT